MFKKTVLTKKKFMKLFPVLLFFFLSLGAVYSQSTFIVVDTISIVGNNTTKSYIIINQLDIKRGDTIYFNNLAIKFKDNRNRILDTGLFVEAILNLKDLNTKTGHCSLEITVKESLFIIPKLIFDLTDRNFNEWYYEHDADLSRINYGIELEHKNITGNKDALQFKWQRGITHKYEMRYIRPFLKKDNRLGLIFNILYKYSKEIAYATLNNKLVFLKNKNYNLLKQFRVSLGLTYRTNIYDTHSFTFYYFDSNVHPDVLKKNADYFAKTQSQKNISLVYSFTKDKRKYKMYPNGGYLLGGQITKRGIGIFDDINQVDITINAEKYFYINKTYISAYIFKGKFRALGDDLPYFNNKAIGYEDDLINGYDLNVVDGKHFMYLKTSQRFKIFSGVMDLDRRIFINQFKYIPYEFYLSINFDVAYVNNNVNFVNNRFENRILHGHGVGIDMLIYNSLFQINYSINHIGEDGVFFYYKASF